MPCDLRLTPHSRLVSIWVRSEFSWRLRWELGEGLGKVGWLLGKPQLPAPQASPKGWLSLFWREEVGGEEERRRKRWGKRQQPQSHSPTSWYCLGGGGAAWRAVLMRSPLKRGSRRSGVTEIQGREGESCFFSLKLSAAPQVPFLPLALELSQGQP